MEYLKSMLAAILICLSLAPAWAGAPDHQPDVSFSPAVIDFGLVPSHERLTQLVIVTFDRRVFPPGHLPTLQPDRLSNNAEVFLFAEFDEPDAIRVVYQVTVHADRSGPIRDTLILTMDKVLSGGRPITLASGSAEISVLGAAISSLTASPSALNFGNVTLGKSKSIKVDVGYYGPGMVQAYTDADAVEKHDLEKLAAAFPRNTPGLANTTVTSSSPLITAQYLRELGFNTSIWQTWIVTFKSRLPLGRDQAELQFRTQAGYYITIPVTAEVVTPDKPEPDPTAKH